MSGIKAKISETVDKLTHRSGTNANTGHGTGHTGTTGSGYDNTSSGYGTSGNTGNLDTTGTTGYNTTSTTGTGMGTTGTEYDTTGSGMGTTGSEYGTTGTTGMTTGTTGGMTTGATMGTGQVIDSETFTKTEDHERLVEKKRYELEHHPVEKKYVVETKFVGEAEVAGAPTEVVGHESNVVDEHIKQAPAGDRTVVVENVDVPASELRSTTTTGMGQTSGTGMGTGTGMGGSTY
jgi:hypothetical protein